MRTDSAHHDLPLRNGITVIVVPAMLVPQWVTELKSLIRPGFIEIEVCSGSYQHRLGSSTVEEGRSFWTDIAQGSTSKISASRRVVLVPVPVCHSHRYTSNALILTTVIQSLESDGKEADTVEKLRHTVFSQDIATLIVDEAHFFRNPQQAHKSLKALVAGVDFLCMLTATPIITKPQVCHR